MARNENKFQQELVKELETRFPDAIVLKNDPNYIQGIPDLTILKGDRWAFLECKRSSNEPYRPNQEHYLALGASMSGYSATIYPENKQEVLDDLERALGCRKTTKARNTRRK